MYTAVPKLLYNIGFFGENRLAGGRFCTFGVAADLIFALASTVLEIFAKTGMLVILFVCRTRKLSVLATLNRFAQALRSAQQKKAPERAGNILSTLVRLHSNVVFIFQ